MSAIDSIRGIERTPPSVPSMTSRSSASSRSSRTPKTTRRMISSVSDPHPLERDHAAAPRAQLRPRELADHRRERAHPRPVKRGLEQPALAQVLFPVEQQDRMRPGERPQELPALAGGRDRRIEAEHLAHGVRMREQHHRLLRPVRADRGRIAKTVVHAAHERRRPRHPRDRLPQGGSAWARRQVHSADATSPAPGSANRPLGLSARGSPSRGRRAAGARSRAPRSPGERAPRSRPRSGRPCRSSAARASGHHVRAAGPLASRPKPTLPRAQAAARPSPALDPGKFTRTFADWLPLLISRRCIIPPDTRTAQAFRCSDGSACTLARTRWGLELRVRANRIIP